MKNLITFILLLSALVIAISAQTTAEYKQYKDCKRALETIQKDRETATLMINAKDTRNSLTGELVDKRTVRARGELKLEEIEKKYEEVSKYIEEFDNKLKKLKDNLLVNNTFRVWTDKQTGRTVDAFLFKIRGEMITIATTDNVLFNLPQSRLSQEDLEFISRAKIPKVSIEAYVEFNENIFPSLLLSGVNWRNDAIFEYIESPNSPLSDEIGDLKSGMIGLKVRPDSNNFAEFVDVGVSVKSSSEYFSDVNNQTYKVDVGDGEEVIIFPYIPWDKKKLGEIDQPIGIDVQLTINDGINIKEVVVNPTVRAYNDCIFRGPGPQGKGIKNYNKLFAAFVQETNPLIDQLKKEAIDKGLVSSFSGKQNPEQAKRELFAIWCLLQSKGIVYSGITDTGANDYGISSQRVRMLEDSLSMEQANCVDGSVLFASIAKNIGIDAYLKITPNHMYFIADVEGNCRDEWIIPIETTMIGHYRWDSNLSLSDNVNKSESIYRNGVDQGIKKLKADLEVHQDSKNYINNQWLRNLMSNYEFIDINACRRSGIRLIVLQ